MILHYTGAEPGAGARALMAQLKKVIQDAEGELDKLEALRVQIKTLPSGQDATAALTQDDAGWLLKLGIPAGPQGAQGPAPVRGVDYWTDADQQTIVQEVLDELPQYSGAVTVEPDWGEQALNTAGKVLRQDVTVKAIHTWEFSNDAGGTTCVIGPEN